MTTVLLAPAFLTYFFAGRGFGPRSLTTLVRLLPAFLVGLLPYAYLPIRATMEPLLDWGHPDRWDRFVAHVTAWQYRGWMFSSREVAGQQLRFFFGRLPGEFCTVGLVPVVFGAVALAQRDARRAAWVGLVFAAGIVFLAGYAIRDIDPYAMPAMLALGVCATVGWVAIHERVGPAPTTALAVALTVATLALHYRACDESANHLPEDYARTVLESLPERAVLFSSQWDYCVSAILYLQTVEHLRQDVTLLNPELLRRGWYVSDLARVDRDLAGAVRPEAERFVQAVRPFEHGARYDADSVEAAYEGLVHALAAHALERRRVFATNEVTGPAWVPWTRVPVGPAFEYRADTTYAPQPFPSWRFRPWRNRVDSYVATQSWIYGVLLLSRMNYEIEHGHELLGLHYGRYALTFDPGLRADRIPPLPLDGRELTLQSISLFTRLRGYLTASGVR